MKSALTWGRLNVVRYESESNLLNMVRNYGRNSKKNLPRPHRALRNFSHVGVVEELSSGAFYLTILTFSKVCCQDDNGRKLIMMHFHGLGSAITVDNIGVLCAWPLTHADTQGMYLLCSQCHKPKSFKFLSTQNFNWIHRLLAKFWRAFSGSSQFDRSCSGRLSDVCRRAVHI